MLNAYKECLQFTSRSPCTAKVRLFSGTQNCPKFCQAPYRAPQSVLSRRCIARLPMPLPYIGVSDVYEIFVGNLAYLFFDEGILTRFPSTISDSSGISLALLLWASSPVEFPTGASGASAVAIPTELDVDARSGCELIVS